METGTLKELNVKPGDVVECVDHGVTEEHLTVGVYYGIVTGPMIQTDKGSWWGEGKLAHTNFPMLAKFRIISRATPTPDLTAITTPFGLLDEATQEALRAHGGPYEWFDGEVWHYACITTDDRAGAFVYRAKKPVVVETEVMTIVNVDGDTVADIHVRIIDGIADWSCVEIKP